MLYKHVQMFYHKDGNLEIQVLPYSKQKASASDGSRHHGDEQGQVQNRQEPGRSFQYAAGGAVFQSSHRGGATEVSGNHQLHHGNSQNIKKHVRNWHQIYMSSACRKCGYSSSQS